MIHKKQTEQSHAHGALENAVWQSLLYSSCPVMAVVLSLKAIPEMVQLTYTDFDHDAVLTMQFANQSAWKLNHAYIDTEHILIGLCRNSGSNASAIFTHYGVTARQLTAELKSRVRRGPHPVDGGKRLAQPNAKRVTQHAVQIAASLDATVVTTSHLLLGMLFVDDSIAFDALSAVGLHYDVVMRYITKA